MPKTQGENAQGRRRGGAPGLQRSASEEKIGEEAAPALGLILERSGDVPPPARWFSESVVNHCKMIADSPRPPHLTAERERRVRAIGRHRVITGKMPIDGEASVTVIVT
jgi:hypothetical protein